MIVTELNGTQVYRLPAYVYPDPPSDDPNVTNERPVAPEPIGVEPPSPSARRRPRRKRSSRASPTRRSST
jgi:hypothetical protein